MSSGDLRVDFVVPRYWLRGGAENAVRMTAERVSALLGWDVHLHATTAESSGTWENAEPAGTQVLNGVTVHRHHVDSGRTVEWGPLNERVKGSPTTIDPGSEAAFFTTQGPVSHDLARAVKASDADLIVFAPYLFWTTIGVLGDVVDRAVVVPAAHDEPFLRLPVVGRNLQAARGLIYGSVAERQLLERVMPVAHLPHTVLGWGIDDPIPADPQRPLPDALPDDGRPFVLCLGRVEHAKGTAALARFWDTYRQRRQPRHRLVMVGEVNAAIPTSDDLVIIDDADDAAKWDLLRAADLLVTPSAMESFSLVVLEAWEADTPVLVNRWCGATHDHARASHGGLWYGDYPEFEVAIDRLLTDADLREMLAANGKRFGRDTYGWESIVDRFQAFCHRALRR
ncbi:MAG: glycosyltransferase family 4 protein [Actinomycetota bacterium]|jgi:glycosyltransferase involved in cell wall biosynthesis|nr:glycosyltransferase family 4 protein [Actinomycetota bacterium]